MARSSLPLRALPVRYTPEMVAEVRSYSPSASKPRAVVASWDALGIPLEVTPPTPVSRGDLARAHATHFVEDVLAGRVDNGFGNRSPAVAASVLWTSGAMLSAARSALANGRVAVAPCSGFHHARYDRCGGFCTFNGLMVAAMALVADGSARRVGILDFDEHYGDGTDDILGRLYQPPVVHYTAGAHYSHHTQAVAFLDAIPALLESFHGCDVLLYQAGADPHMDDPLGGWLTTAQLAERDLRVFTGAEAMGLPVAWNLAGGYQEPLRRVLDIHDNTLRACARVHLG